jgi:hypothetical protein
MDKSEIRAILSAYRPGEPEIDDARFQQAKAAAEADPELARWWAEQQELDRVIAANVQSAEVPRDLKMQLTAWEQRSVRRDSWSRGIWLAAASIVALAVLFSAWRGAFQPAPSLAEYRDEMVSFIRLSPPLDLESAQLSRLTSFLQEKGAPSQIHLPEKLRQLDPVGCRRLRFRGHDVALLCFEGGGGEIVHLLVIDRKALARVSSSSKDPEVAGEEEWMTAAWVEGDYVYLVSAKGSREALEKYISHS